MLEVDINDRAMRTYHDWAGEVGGREVCHLNTYSFHQGARLFIVLSPLNHFSIVEWGLEEAGRPVSHSLVVGGEKVIEISLLDIRVDVDPDRPAPVQITPLQRILQLRESRLLCLVGYALASDVIGDACKDRCIDQPRIGIEDRIGVCASHAVAYEGDLRGRGTEFVGAKKFDEFFDDGGVDGGLRDVAGYPVWKWLVRWSMARDMRRTSRTGQDPIDHSRRSGTLAQQRSPQSYSSLVESRDASSFLSISFWLLIGRKQAYDLSYPPPWVASRTVPFPPLVGWQNVPDIV